MQVLAKLSFTLKSSKLSSNQIYKGEKIRIWDLSVLVNFTLDVAFENILRYFSIHDVKPKPMQHFTAIYYSNWVSNFKRILQIFIFLFKFKYQYTIHTELFALTIRLIIPMSVFCSFWHNSLISPWSLIRGSSSQKYV